MWEGMGGREGMKEGTKAGRKGGREGGRKEAIKEGRKDKLGRGAKFCVHVNIAIAWSLAHSLGQEKTEW